jgi:hypothetical protein
MVKGATERSSAASGRAFCVGLGLLLGCSKDAPISQPIEEKPEAGERQTDRERSGTFSATTAPEVEPVSNPTGLGPTGLFNPANVQWQDWLTDECADMKVPKPGEVLGPPIRWKPCTGDLAGCQELEITWEHVPSGPYRAVQVFTHAGGIALSVHVETPSSRVSDAVVSWKFLGTAEGANLGAWRSGSCGSVFLEGVGDHLCLGAGRSTAGKETIGFVALLPADDPMTLNPIVAPMNAMGNFDCSSKLIRGSDSGGRLWCYDVDASQEHEVTFPGGIPHMPSLFEDQMLVTRGGALEGKEFLDGWVWTPGEEAKPLIQPESGFVFDLETDGHDLVWTVAHGDAALEWDIVEVWVSPLSFDARQLSPRLLGEVPNTRASTGYGMARNGYYAVSEGNLAMYGMEPTELHIFRLSDGARWTAPKPAETEPGAPLHVDSEEVWYKAIRGGIRDTIVRQRIDALVEAE